MMSSAPHQEGEETNIVHCGEIFVNVPGMLSTDSVSAIHMSTSYLFSSAEGILGVSRGDPGYVYRRYGNENVDNLTNAIKSLENAAGGVCFASGMGAISSSLVAAGILSGNKVLLGPYSCYGSTYSLLRKRFSNVAKCEFVDMGNTALALDYIQRIKPDILYMETSSNPLTVITDLQALCAEAKLVNPKVICIVDSTFSTPLFVKPLSLGADVVIHSVTKYLNGHGDVLGGIVLSNNKEYLDNLVHTVIDFGATLSPFDAWLALRGLRTLGVRMARISDNAFAVAKYLSTHPCISKVLHPGLPSHPHFETTKRILCKSITPNEAINGFPFSGMIAFEIASEANNFSDVIVFLNSMKLISNQVSLGDVKTLASCPGLSTQQQLDPSDVINSGITSHTIRLSLGMEDVRDICRDIDQALNRAVNAHHSHHSRSMLEEDSIQSVPLIDSLSLQQANDKLEKKTNTHAQHNTASSHSSSPIVNSSVRTERKNRLVSIYDQINQLTAEAEGIQAEIKRENAALQAFVIE